MQPAALSPEPLILLAAFVFLIAVLPVANLIALKFRPGWRIAAVTVGLIVLVWTTFSLGRMTGLSMAWGHWRMEYQSPLLDWQYEMNDMAERGDTNGLMRMVERFRKENVQAYGREKLFQQGKFREFVEEVKK